MKAFSPKSYGKENECCEVGSTPLGAPQLNWPPPMRSPFEDLACQKEEGMSSPFRSIQHPLVISNEKVWWVEVVFRDPCNARQKQAISAQNCKRLTDQERTGEECAP